MANIDDMAKLSGEKMGVFSTLANMAKDKMASVASVFEGDSSEIYDKCQKFASMDVESFPSEIREPLRTFKDAYMFQSDALRKMDKSTLGNVSALVDTLETLIAKEANFKGEKTPLNKDYADIQKAFREYVEVVTKYDEAMVVKTIVDSSTLEQQTKDLGIDSFDKETAELITAFAYMGMKVMPDGKGSFTYMEIPERGVPYSDASGKTQYIRISPEATKEVIDKYLKTGGPSCAEEERNLAEQKDRLKEMRNNQKEGGFYAPTNDDIVAQEKEVEKAQKALEERRAQRISKKGLYAYFLKELKSNTSARTRNKELMRAVEEKFSVNSPEEQLFSIKNNPNILKDDMMMCALHAIKKEDMDALSSVEGDSAFVDNANSKFASGVRNSNRLENILDDIAETYKSAEQVSEDNKQAMSDIVDKYTTLASKLEILSASYKGSPREAELKREARECLSFARSIEGFAGAVSAISNEILSGSMEVPEEVSAVADGGSAKLVSVIMDAVEIKDGVITVTKDLSYKDGSVWLSQKDLQDYFQNANMSMNANQNVSENEDEEEYTYNPERLPNVLAYSLNHEMSEGVTVNDLISKDAMYDRVVSLIDVGDNLIADIYNDFKGRDITASEYVDMLKENGTDFSNGVYGIADTDVFTSVFDYCKFRDTEREKNADAEISMEANCAGYADARKQADMAYYHIDSVALAIYGDEKLREKFENAKPSEKQKIFADTLQKLKENGSIKTNPDSERLSLARNRLANHYSMGAIQNLVEGLEQFDGENKEIYDKLTKAFVEIYGNKEKEQGEIEDNLQSNGEKVIDANNAQNNQDFDGNENEEEAPKLRKFGEIFPRGTPSTKIAKMLQPYNIKVGKKFLDQLIEAFRKVKVQDPFAKKDNKFVAGYKADGKDSDENDNKNENDSAKDNVTSEAGTDVNKNEDVSLDTQANANDGGDNKQEQTATNDTVNDETEKHENVKDETEKHEPTKDEIAKDETVIEADNSAQKADETTKDESNKEAEETTEKVDNKSVFEGYTEDRIRARVSMVAVGLGVSSIVEQVEVEKENADLIKSAMDYMTLYDQPQPVVSINVNGRTSQLILADAMQYVFLNEFASGNKTAKDAGISIDAITTQLKTQLKLKENEEHPLVNMVKSIKPLMGAITPAEVVNLVRMTAKIQIPQPGEPMSIDLGSNLSQEDIAKFQQAKSLEELKDMVSSTPNVYNQHLVNQIMQTEQLRRSSKFRQAQGFIKDPNREMEINQ